MTRLPDSLIRYLRERREQEAALGLRGYGRKRVVEALAEIADALKGVDDPVVHSFDEESPGLLRMLDQVADPDQYNSKIPHDGAAMDALENLAQTIGVAFELGKAAGSGKVDEQAWRQRHAQINARESAKARGKKADRKWRSEAMLLHHTHRGQFAEGDDRRLSHGDLVVIVHDPKTGIKGAPGDRELRRQFSKWDEKPPTIDTGPLP